MSIDDSLRELEEIERLGDLREAADKYRESLLGLLREVMVEIDMMGMGFQDEPWWPEYCALFKKLRVRKED